MIRNGEVDALRKEIEELRRERKRMAEALAAAVDAGLVLHEEGCPEDDTCECEVVARINAALRPERERR